MTMIIDSHSHLPSPGRAGHNFSEARPQIDAWRKLGINGAIFTTWQGVMAASADDIEQGNRAALDIYAKFSDFVLPGVSVHPKYPELSLQWIHEFHRQNLLWAGEWCPADQLEFDAPEYEPFFALCEELGMVVQLHNSKGIIPVAKRHPQLTIVAAHVNHAFIGEEGQLPNLWLDISGLYGGLCWQALEKAKDAFGTKRLFYGTDFDGYDPEIFIYRVKTHFTPEEQQDIFHRNLLAFLRNNNINNAFGLNY